MYYIMYISISLESSSIQLYLFLIVFFKNLGLNGAPLFCRVKGLNPPAQSASTESFVMYTFAVVKDFKSCIFTEYINHTAYENCIVKESLSKSVIATLQ